jgi:hypothetical protein
MTDLDKVIETVDRAVKQAHALACAIEGIGEIDCIGAHLGG